MRTCHSDRFVFAAVNWLQTGRRLCPVRSRPGAACQPQSLRFSFGMEARGLLSLSEHLPSPPWPRSSPSPKISSIQPHQSSVGSTNPPPRRLQSTTESVHINTICKSMSERSSVYCLFVLLSNEAYEFKLGRGFCVGMVPPALTLLSFSASIHLSFNQKLQTFPLIIPFVSIFCLILPLP